MTTLPTRTLGRTGLEVTVLGFGAMELRGSQRGRPVTPDQADSVLNGVLASGINYVDTSIDYGDSEEFIGSFIAARRDQYFLASKCGCVPGAVGVRGQPSPHSFDRATIEAGIDQSLQRMKTDHLDLVQVHMSPSREVMEKEGVVETLLDAKQKGKVRFIGASSTLPNISDHIAMGVFDVFQIPYSGLERDHEHVISEAARSGAGVVIRGGVAKGRPGAGSGSRKDWELLDDEEFAPLLGEMSKAEFMLRYTISHPDMATTIVGTLNPEHLATNVAAAAKGPLPTDVYEEAKRRFAAVGSVPAEA